MSHFHGHGVLLRPDTILIGYGPNDAQSLSDKIYFNQEHMLSVQNVSEEEEVEMTIEYIVKH
jgi:hypothetical protein